MRKRMTTKDFFASGLCSRSNIVDYTHQPNNRVISIPEPKKKYDYYIGIDTGVNTGYAIWGEGEQDFIYVMTIPIHQALNRVKNWIGMKIFVRVEDARLATYGRNDQIDSFKAQGAGSVKRDAKIWEDFLTDHNIPFELVRPQKSNTKLSSEKFKNITGWKERTDSHGRDAAMLVYKFKR